jgi:hypothetical protein
MVWTSLKRSSYPGDRWYKRRPFPDQPDCRIEARCSFPEHSDIPGWCVSPDTAPLVSNVKASILLPTSEVRGIMDASGSAALGMAEESHSHAATWEHSTSVEEYHDGDDAFLREAAILNNTAATMAAKARETSP